MIFHSWEFGVFLIVTLVLYWTLARHRTARTVLLLAASYFFYGSWEPWFLILILFSTVLDYQCGKWIASAGSPRSKKLGLLTSLGGNLLLLCFFKYSKWGLEMLAPLIPTSVHDKLVNHVWADVVPVGISFYTFQTLSYTIDIYRGLMKPARNILDCALFVAYFPQLVAGPIVRAIDFLPQLELRPRFDRARLHDGLYRICTGLIKKALIADVLAEFLVTPVYANPGAYSPYVHVLAIFGFTFQIYFDFSGYTDIAIGAARMFGFDLPENFASPFKSQSIREFWRRWHITLSSWVRDYVYYPLGGSRKSEVRVAFNLIITMVIIGLWHGASLLWLIYGLMQGIMMTIERLLERARGGRKFATTGPKKALSWVMTFSFVALTLLCVRATSFEQAIDLLTKFGPSSDLSHWAYVALAASFLTHFQPQSWVDAFKARLVSLPTIVLGILMGAVAGALVAVKSSTTAFIYFQF